jgi:hypothetical protein
MSKFLFFYTIENRQTPSDEILTLACHADGSLKGYTFGNNVSVNVRILIIVSYEANCRILIKMFHSRRAVIPLPPLLPMRLGIKQKVKFDNPTCCLD